MRRVRMRGPVDIVDAQLHGNAVGPRAKDVDPDVTVDAVVAAMDAVGIDAVVCDEFWDLDERLRARPGHEAPSGAWRSDHPFMERAIARFPNRFAYVSRVDHNDPDLRSLVAEFRGAPGRLALRVFSGSDGQLWRDPAWLEGSYNSLFEVAEQHAVPVFVLVSSRLETLEPYLKRFPDLQFIVDHMGVLFPSIDVPDEERYSRLDPVVELASYENVALKWSHVERLAREPYPYRDVMPHFRRVVDAYGPERILWASDHTQSVKSTTSPHPSSWSESLYYLAESEYLSEPEKEWILGRSIRTILRWWT